MIENEQQYRITSDWARKFEQTLAELQGRPLDKRLKHPKLRQAEEDSLQSTIEDLRQQMRDYEAKRPRQPTTLTLESFEELPGALIKARIAQGLTQKQLAERMGLKEQQIQRYEATKYASASLTRVGQVIRALGIQVCGEVVLPGK